MINPKKTLKDLFYFINGEVIYNIDSANDEDKCGVQKVVYTDPEKKNQIDWEASAAIFPSFKVTFTLENGDSKDVYYYLQDLIVDGDKFTGGKFVHQHPADEPKTYIEMFTDSIDSDIKAKASNGYTVDEIMAALPFYCVAPTDEDMSFTDNDGKSNKGKFESMEGFSAYTVVSVTDIVYDELDKKAKAYANNLLKPHKKQLKSSVSIINNGNIEDIPESEG